MTTVGEMTQNIIEDVAHGLEEAGWKPGDDPIIVFPVAVYRRIRDRISRIEENSYQLGRKRERDRRDYDVSC